MDIDVRFAKIEKDIKKLFKMFYRLLAIFLVLGKIDATYVEDILSIVKETDDE